jgi:hypothetical protein
MGVATAIAIGTSVASAGASAKQASNAAGFAKEAQSKAKVAFDKAMKDLSANKLAGISLPMEPYERQMEAARGAGAELTQAGKESERGAAAIAGQVYRGQTDAQRNIAGDMAQQLTGLETAAAEEEANLSRARATLSLAEAEGAQAAAAQFGAQQDAAITGAFSALGQAGQQYLQGSELYKKSKGVKEFQKLSDYASNKGMTQEEFQKNLVALSSDPRFSNLSGVGYSATGVDAQGKPITGLMTQNTLNDYMGKMGKDYNKAVYDAFVTKFPNATTQPVSIAPQQGGIPSSTTRFGQNIMNASQSPFQNNVNFQLPYYLGF